MKPEAYLKELREERGLSLRDVQERTGISNSLLSQIERGLRSLTLKTARPLAELYGVPAIELMKAHSGGKASVQKKGTEFDYEAGYRDIVRKHLGHEGGFAARAFDEVPHPLKKLLVQLEAKATGQKFEEPRFTFLIRHSTNEANTEFSVLERNLKGAILVNASIAGKCMDVLRSTFGAVYEVTGRTKRIIELSDRDFVESQGIKPAFERDGVPYYDLAEVLNQMALFAQAMERSYVVAEPEMPEAWNRRRQRRNRSK
jgi:transcriptional regulator with XRE-family HTH domain